MGDNQGVTAKRDRAYYMDNTKFIRDLVHGYVYLTKFDLELIDTPEFQRLKDIRQLTCQNVYPAARHTRFEHSLGVLELTRQALKNLNQNCILTNPSSKGTEIFGDRLTFNAALAALLHDVGHCPFSHMGEVEFDKVHVFDSLCDLITKCEELKDTSLLKDFQKNKPGSTHEQMSCVVILGKLYRRLSSAGWTDKDGSRIRVDFELIIRSIIGLPYDMSSQALYEENKQKNVIVGLINSKIFDMDKLDYIMRDALCTGIGTPSIDTHRLFNNMYINSERNYTLVFLQRAVPALQNMVEARDALYMYVYNHHVTVFSDFMYSYIFRRLTHNADAFRHLIRASVPPDKIQAWEKARVAEETYTEEAEDAAIAAENEQDSLDAVLQLYMLDPIISLGIMPKSYLFSPEAILEQKRSDSDMISLLHDIYYALSQYDCFDKEDAGLLWEKTDELKDILCSEIRTQLLSIGISPEDVVIPQEALEQMIANIHRVFLLMHQYQTRAFLKPWWKTTFEFASFIERNFPGTEANEKLGEWISNKDDDTPSGDEFRSQLAKHVIYITQELQKRYENTGLLEQLNDGDFFVIERSSHFLDKDTIAKLNIALKNNEILGRPGQDVSITEDYYIDRLTKIFPQRDFYGLYERKGFYIFSKPLKEDMGDPLQRKRHYRLIEEIFVFTAKYLTQERGFTFQNRFVTPDKAERCRNERESWEALLTAFAESKGFKETCVDSDGTRHRNQ